MRYVCPEGCVEDVGMSKPHPDPCPEHGPFVYEKQLKRGGPMRRVSEKRQAEEDSGTRLKRRGNGLSPGRGFAASKAQQAKVKGLPCVNCGGGEYVGLDDAQADPAHLIPRRWVKCEHPDGVIPLCRHCHGLYDEEHLDILGKLEDRGYHAEMAHFIAEHKVNPLTLLRYVGGGEYVLKSPRPQPSPTEEGLTAAPEGAA